MKICSCTIEGFGKLHRKSYFFGDGIHVIYGPNEAGKTTLRTFLVSMFFGLDRKRGIASKKDEYHRYQPYMGGNYGGSLNFTWKDEEYQVQRNFHQPGDISLYRSSYGKKVLEGKELTGSLFSMTKEGFLQTLCIRQGAIKTGQPLVQMLQYYLTNMTHSRTTDIDAAKAIDYLQKERRKLKRNPVGSKIQMIREQLQEMEDVTAQCRSIEQGIAVLEKKIDQLEEPKTLWERIKAWIRQLFGLVDPDELERQKLEYEAEILHMQKQEFEKKLQLNEDLRIQLEKFKKEAEEIAYNENAIKEAILAIEEAAEEIHETFGSDFQDKVSSIIASITDGAYGKIHIDDAMGMRVVSDGAFLDIDYLSTGTVEQIYFAVRLAAAQLMFPDEKFPLILDDIFGNFDDARMEKTVGYLATLDRQVLIFTCRKDVIETIKRVGCGYQMIEVME